MIEFNDFAKVEMRIGRVVEVHPFPEARKPSYQLRIDQVLLLGAMGDDGAVWLLEPNPASPLGLRVG